MPSADLCTEEEIVQLVYGFYDAVRRDEVLGPVFNRHVGNWDAHLPTMVDFWSSALRGTARFRGSPMVKHAALPGLSIALFQRWLGLFRQTTGALPNTALAEQANDLAQRIAHSLWYGYQKTQDSAHLGRPLEPSKSAL
ncbi:group III truncated hemoglobin [soil metagenome]